MRILHVIATLDSQSGGPAKACVEMAQAVAALGHEVDIATTNWAASGDTETGAEQLAPGCRVETFPVGFPRLWKRSPALANALFERAASYDLLHIHSLYLFHNWIAAAAARRAGRPYIVRPHGLLDPYIRRRHRMRKLIMDLGFQNKALRQATLMHYTSEDEMRISEPHACGAPGVVVPLGVDLPVEIPGSRRVARQILFLSRLHPKKGLDLLIPAFALVRARFDDVELVVAGPDDGALAMARSLVAKHRLESSVAFPGMLQGTAKAQAFADAAVFVLPSYSENFGIAVAEAMAAGLPVVVSDQVAIHGDILAADAGLVVPCEIASLANAIIRMLANPADAERLGRNGRNLVARRFAWHAIGRQLESVYQRAISGNLLP